MLSLGGFRQLELAGVHVLRPLDDHRTEAVNLDRLLRNDFLLLQDRDLLIVYVLAKLHVTQLRCNRLLRRQLAVWHAVGGATAVLGV